MHALILLFDRLFHHIVIHHKAVSDVGILFIDANKSHFLIGSNGIEIMTVTGQLDFFISFFLTKLRQKVDADPRISFAPVFFKQIDFT